MKKQAASHTQKSVTDIAREALILLGSRRTPPSPEAFARAFHEIAGIASQSDFSSIAEVSDNAETGEAAIRKKFVTAVSALEDCALHLTLFNNEKFDLENSLFPASQTNKFKQYSQILGDFLNKPRALVTDRFSFSDEEPSTGDPYILREIMIRTLSVAVPALLYDSQDLAAEADRLGRALGTLEDQKTSDIARALKEFCEKIELQGSSSAQQLEMLLRLFRLLLKNIGSLLDEDSWLKGQIESMRELISGPINIGTLEFMEASLNDVIYKQGLLRQSLNDARESTRQLQVSFVDQLTHITESTESYHSDIKNFSQHVRSVNNMNELNEMLETIMFKTDAIQADTYVSYNQMQSAQIMVDEAKIRIKTLESQLEKVSELVREDMLTGSLNRRGMEEAFEREIVRSERNGTPLSVAFLDVDDFRHINMTYGHFAGDEALIHLVRTIKDGLRPTDVVARYGGEEFIVIFPETDLDVAVTTMQRMQRELTRHFFMHKQKKIVFTFSAGVALHASGERWDAVSHRANEAMRVAKRKGKNRVFAAATPA